MTHSQTETYSTTADSGSKAYSANDQTGGQQSKAQATKDVAAGEARNVGQTAAEAGSQVATTAADEAKHVALEAKQQATNVISQGRQQVAQQVQTQARNGQQKAAQGLSSIAGELRSMAENSQQSGPATDLVRQATSKIDEVATWIEAREPGDLLDEVRSFARRRPGAFLLGAAVAGVLAGRLTTGVVASHKDSSPSSTTGRPSSAGNYVDQTRTPATGYSQGLAPETTQGYSETYTSDYAGTTTGSVPPPPYGTVPPAEGVVPATTPAGWDDPQRGLGERGGQQ